PPEVLLDFREVIEVVEGRHARNSSRGGTGIPACLRCPGHCRGAACCALFPTTPRRLTPVHRTPQTKPRRRARTTVASGAARTYRHSAMSYRAAVRHLKRVDPVMRRIIERVGPCRLAERVQTNRLRALVTAIIAQQISWPAARTVEARFCALYGCDSANFRAKFPRAEQILTTPVRRLRSAGLSRQKVKYIRDIAARAASGALPLARLGRMNDDAVIECL